MLYRTTEEGELHCELHCKTRCQSDIKSWGKEGRKVSEPTIKIDFARGVNSWPLPYFPSLISRWRVRGGFRVVIRTTSSKQFDMRWSFVSGWGCGWKSMVPLEVLMAKLKLMDVLWWDLDLFEVYCCNSETWFLALLVGIV